MRRWHLPDRVFFAAGACHVLAHAFLERFVREPTQFLHDALPRARRYLDRFDHRALRRGERS